MRFPGIIPAVTTPFDASGAVDTAALEGNVTALLDAGVHGIVATGTMGEAGSLSNGERRTVVAAVVEAVEGRVPVIVGVSAGTPAAAIALAADAAEAGASALMMLPPLGYRGDAREIEAPLPRGRRGRRAAADGLQQPRGERHRHARRPDHAALRGGRRDRRRQGVLGRRAADPGADQRGARSRGARRRRRLGARGLRRRRDRLGERRRRHPSARVRRALRRLPGGRPRDGAGDLRAAAAARALRHDAQARAVLQGRDGRGRLRRRPVPPAAARRSPTSERAALRGAMAVAVV